YTLWFCTRGKTYTTSRSESTEAGVPAAALLASETAGAAVSSMALPDPLAGFEDDASDAAASAATDTGKLVSSTSGPLSKAMSDSTAGNPFLSSSSVTRPGFCLSNGTSKILQ